ncbi:MAG: insulinase family protein [Elusimicrobia bacterium]|nr:insulinase family protein [Elusimicrobiota bacterium]
MRAQLGLGLFLMTAAFATARAEGITVKVFANGLKWIHRPVTHNRIMAFQLFIPGGAILEPEPLSGVTQLMASTMVKGTIHRSALELAQEMELLGASFGLDAQPDVLAAGGQVIIDKWAPTFDVFEDVLLYPSFPQEEVDKEREALLNALKTKDEHIFSVAEELFRREMFGAHPYGRPDEGTEESVAQITRDQLRDWHRERVSPRGAVLVTVGRVPMGPLTRRVEKFAKAWTSPGGSALPVAPIAYPSKVRSAQGEGKFEQAYLMVGYPAPAVSSDDYPAMKLVNALLGGGMSSPLFQSVREEGSLAYEVSSFYPSRKAGSAFVVYAGMDPHNLHLAEQKVRSVLADFAAQPPSPQDLEDAKTYIRGHYLMDHQTNGRIAWYLGWWEILGKGYAYDTVYPDVISALTADEIHRISRDLFAHPSVTVHVINKPAKN